MLQVRENEISLRKWFGGSAQLRTSEGILLLSQRTFLYQEKFQRFFNIAEP